MSKEEKTASGLKDSVIALAEKLEKGMELDAKAGLITETCKLYEENLPEGLTMEVDKAVDNYRRDFIAAGAYAFGKTAVNAMAKDKKLEKVTGSLQVGSYDHVDYNADRERTFTNHLKDGKEVTMHGVVSTGYRVRAGKNGGQLKTARELISEYASQKLK